ncbi:MAG: tRNA (mo5U34)-methyltransferase [Candidatus Omnitrophota bacterium]|jgi:tRNA (mo5U34)-methyltransferase
MIKDRTHLENYIGLESFESELRPLIEAAWNVEANGHIPLWLDALNNLPQVLPSSFDLSSNAIRIGHANDIDTEQNQDLLKSLRTIMPWRKGPYDFFGNEIDTEWRCWVKWDRLKNALPSLQGKRIIDIGCGNGYFLWRLMGEGAASALGIERHILYQTQLLMVQHYLKHNDVNLLPITLEQIPQNFDTFDMVLSMGVLYHAKDPIEHLERLKRLCHKGSTLVLETLMIDEPGDACLRPEGRYAKMRNVYTIPSLLLCESWLAKVGFKNIALVDVNQTSFEEQRMTEWMDYESLPQFLYPTDVNRTIEGYPAPKRAMFICEV